MLIILTLYIVLVWLIFSKLKLIRWGWGSGTAAVLIGAFILAVFVALFNYLTPSGSFVVGSRVTEVTPNVSGQVIEIPVKPNERVKAGTVLFRIDPAPFQYKVNQLEASLAQARQQVKQLTATTSRRPRMPRGWPSSSPFTSSGLTTTASSLARMRRACSACKTPRSNTRRWNSNCRLRRRRN